MSDAPTTRQTPEPCPRCGAPHLTPHGGPSCAAHHAKTLDENGQPLPLLPCRAYAVKGMRVCRFHGGSTKNAKAGAARRLAEESARKVASSVYGRPVPDVDLAEAMIRAVAWKHAECCALRDKLAEIEDKDLVWGDTKDAPGTTGGMTQEARLNLWWDTLHKSEDQLVRFAAAARAAGCDERRVRVAEEQGDMVAEVLKTILALLLTSLVDAGMDARLGTVWSAAVAQIVPRELRRLVAEA